MTDETQQRNFPPDVPSLPVFVWPRQKNLQRSFRGRDPRGQYTQKLNTARRDVRWQTQGETKFGLSSEIMIGSVIL